ncbi:DUF6274 family protein [Streptomyces sp. NPDC003023]|uniref:DUF6274 family protein n=1 Tax=Streptomyces sp. NPDC003023 TaxID=3364675 RepID=UPI0036CB7372
MAASTRRRYETRALLRAHLSAASGYRHLTRSCPICHRLLRLAMERPEHDARPPEARPSEPRLSEPRLSGPPALGTLPPEPAPEASPEASPEPPIELRAESAAEDGSPTKE